MVSGLDQAEDRDLPALPLYFPRFPGTAHPGPTVTALRTGRCWGANYFLLIFTF